MESSVQTKAVGPGPGTSEDGHEGPARRETFSYPECLIAMALVG